MFDDCNSSLSVHKGSSPCWVGAVDFTTTNLSSGKLLTKKQFKGYEFGKAQMIPEVSPFLQNTSCNDFARHCRPDLEPGNMEKFQFDAPLKC